MVVGVFDKKEKTIEIEKNILECKSIVKRCKLVGSDKQRVLSFQLQDVIPILENNLYLSCKTSSRGSGVEVDQY